MRRNHSTTPRLSHVLGSLLLLAAAGVGTLGADRTAQAAAPTPLNRVVPAPASVTPGGTPYRITRDLSLSCRSPTTAPAASDSGWDRATSAPRATG